MAMKALLTSFSKITILLGVPAKQSCTVYKGNDFLDILIISIWTLDASNEWIKLAIKDLFILNLSIESVGNLIVAILLVFDILALIKEAFWLLLLSLLPAPVLRCNCSIVWCLIAFHCKF
uniref:hypothetical protein n=1 Tax=Agaricus bitorquis TaxID=5343 RepID=UPI0027A5CA95|nr:hypothetical protein QLP03_mgp068 [Agaricus bitorquis]YP_010833313.1 hypothetical protein QLP03_mgp008 [Agaricus bitorquis]WFG54000.1 hypothetical protein [Agaricus bitorquis]WFG54060.1 hypothetical protein [Agaricus bitorquis]